MYDGAEANCLGWCRPKTLEEVKSQDHATFVLRRLVQASNLPHLLLYGPPGTGKTSTILALAKELYGPQLYQSRILELNASDERGIQIIRGRIKDFAQQALSTPPVSKEYREKYSCPPFKIIILDEADSLTQGWFYAWWCEFQLTYDQIRCPVRTAKDDGELQQIDPLLYFKSSFEDLYLLMLGRLVLQLCDENNRPIGKPL